VIDAQKERIILGKREILPAGGRKNGHEGEKKVMKKEGLIRAGLRHF